MWRSFCKRAFFCLTASATEIYENHSRTKICSFTVMRVSWLTSNIVQTCIDACGVSWLTLYRRALMHMAFHGVHRTDVYMDAYGLHRTDVYWCIWFTVDRSYLHSSVRPGFHCTHYHLFSFTPRLVFFFVFSSYAFKVSEGYKVNPQQHLIDGSSRKLRVNEVYMHVNLLLNEGERGNCSFFTCYRGVGRKCMHVRKNDGYGVWFLNFTC